MLMLSVPEELGPQIRQVPDDFQPQFTDDGRRIAWRGNVTVETPSTREQIAISLGFSKTGTEELQTRLRETLRIAVWYAKELARIGRADLLANARVDRHNPSKRPISKPEIAASAPTEA